MGKELKLYGQYVLTGVALIALPVLFFTYNGFSWQPLEPHEHLIQNTAAYFFLVLFSYFNHTVFVPRWFLTKQYQRYFGVIIGCLLLVAYLPYRIEQWAFFKPPRQPTPTAWVRQILVEEMMFERPPRPPFRPGTGGPFPPIDSSGSGSILIRPTSPPGRPPTGQPPRHSPYEPVLPLKLAFLFLLGAVSTLLSISVQTTNRLHRVENDQLKAELRQLKAQIQPHFLFNTLNSIYALAIRGDERTADTIVKLAEFMRYIIRDAHRDRVRLALEINYIGNYIELQRARLRDAVRIDYQLDGPVGEGQIVPLILFSFIENAFKHGVNPDEDSFIRIHLAVRNGELQLDVTNNKVQISHLDESTGVGLRNARERLKLLYPARHKLIVDDTPTQFYVRLTLTLI